MSLLCSCGRDGVQAGENGLVSSCWGAGVSESLVLSSGFLSNEISVEYYNVKERGWKSFASARLNSAVSLETLGVGL